MNETDLARERAHQQHAEHMQSCDDCNLAFHGRGRECRQGAAITRRLRALGGAPGLNAPGIPRPQPRPPAAPPPSYSNAPLPTKLCIEGPVTRQGVRNLDVVGGRTQMNKRKRLPCERGRVPHNFDREDHHGVCVDCGVRRPPIERLEAE